MQKINSTKQTRSKVATSRIPDNYESFPYITQKVYNFICECGLSHNEFAKKINMAQQSISRLFRAKEDGSYPTISATMRENMIRAFNLPLDWFIVDSKANPDDAPVGTNRKAVSARMQYVKEYLISTGRITSIYNLSVKMKVTREFIPMVFDGRMEVTLDFLNALNETFGYIFDIQWILTGEGRMLSETDDSHKIIQQLKDEVEELKKQLTAASMEIIRLNQELRELKG